MIKVIVKWPTAVVAALMLLMLAGMAIMPSSALIPTPVLPIQPAPPIPAPPVYTDSSNGKTVSLPAGTIFYVKLSANPSTGYEWNLSVSSGLKVLSQKYIPSPAPKGIVGAGGYELWEIQTIKPGANWVKACYSRPWEKQPPIKKFLLNVKVLPRLATPMA
jgi:predicted secreted protein